MPEASRVEEEITQAYSDAEVTLIEGRGGIFEIWVEDTLLFSKLNPVGMEYRRFPVKGETVMLIGKALGR